MQSLWRIGQIVGSSIDEYHNINYTYKNCQFCSAGKPRQESLKQESKTHEKANCNSFKNLKDEKVQTDRKHSNLSDACTQTNLEDNSLNLSYLNYRGAKMVNKAAGNPVTIQSNNTKPSYNLGKIRHLNYELKTNKQALLVYQKQTLSFKNKFESKPELKYNLSDVDCFSEDFEYVLIQSVRNKELQKNHHQYDEISKSYWIQQFNDLSVCLFRKKHMKCMVQAGQQLMIGSKKQMSILFLIFQIGIRIILLFNGGRES